METRFDSLLGSQLPGAPAKPGWLSESFAKFLREQKGYTEEQIAAECAANGLPAPGVNPARPAVGLSDDLLDRVEAALNRHVSGSAPRRIPVDLTDSDIVLTDLRQARAVQEQQKPAAIPAASSVKTIECFAEWRWCMRAADGHVVATGCDTYLTENDARKAGEYWLAPLTGVQA